MDSDAEKLGTELADHGESTGSKLVFLSDNQRWEDGGVKRHRASQLAVQSNVGLEM